MAEILAHQDIYHQLTSNLRQEKLFPVLLFFGPSGVGKRLVAKSIVKDMFCQKQTNAQADAQAQANTQANALVHMHCNHCPACLKVERDEFEAFHILKPEGNFIKVDAVRDLLQKLTLRNLHGKTAILIEDADKLNPQSANALLKTFEEPPPDTYFFLLSNQVNSLLPTIRSRSLPIGFRRLDTEDLKKLAPNAPRWTIQASQGRMDVLQSYLQEDLTNERRKALDFVALLFENSKYTVFQNIKDYIKEDNSYMQLSFFMQMFFRDASVFKLNPAKAFFQDQKSLLQKFAQLPEKNLDLLFQKSLQIEKQILANQDKGLVLESFWLESRKLCVSL